MIWQNPRYPALFQFKAGICVINYLMKERPNSAFQTIYNFGKKYVKALVFFNQFFWPINHLKMIMKFSDVMPWIYK